MANLYTSYGADFDMVFKTGSGQQWFGITDDTGTDIGNKYLAGTSPFGTGFYAPSGQDVRALLLTDAAAKFADIRRTSGSGWDAIGSTDTKRGYSATYLAQRRQYLLNNLENTSIFTVCGSTDSWGGRIPKYENGSKLYRISSRPGMPALTGIRVALTGYYEYKAGIAPFHVGRLSDTYFGFVLGGYSRTNGDAHCTLNIYGQTALGEYQIYSAYVQIW